MTKSTKLKRRVLTEREKLMRKKYTRVVELPFSYAVFLSVGVQSFQIGGDFKTKFKAKWTQDMLAIALSRIEL